MSTMSTFCYSEMLESYLASKGIELVANSLTTIVDVTSSVSSIPLSACVARAKKFAYAALVSTTLAGPLNASFTSETNPKNSIARTTDFWYGTNMRAIEWYGTLRKFDRLKNLSAGWDSYSAKAPNGIAITESIEFVKCSFANEIVPTHVGPSGMGGVGVTFAFNDREVVVEFYNSGMAHSLFSNDTTGEMMSEAVELNVYDTFLKKVSNHLNGN